MGVPEPAEQGRRSSWWEGKGANAGRDEERSDEQKVVSDIYTDDVLLPHHSPDSHFFSPTQANALEYFPPTGAMRRFRLHRGGGGEGLGEGREERPERRDSSISPTTDH